MHLKKTKFLSYILLIMIFSVISTDSLGCHGLQYGKPGSIGKMNSCAPFPIQHSGQIARTKRPVVIASLQAMCQKRLLQDDAPSYLYNALRIVTQKSNFFETFYYELSQQAAHLNKYDIFKEIIMYLGETDFLNIGYYIATTSLNHSSVNITLLEILESSPKLRNDNKKKIISLFKKFSNIPPIDILHEAIKDPAINLKAIIFLLSKGIKLDQLLSQKLETLENNQNNREKLALVIKELSKD